ncbi:MAG: hypothetical protein ACXW5U_15910 [Thermoanaerobaculia bacterium]
MNFETGVIRLVALLEDISWPTALAWVRHNQVLYRPFLGTAIFRPLPDREAEDQARKVFDDRYGKAPGVLFYAVGHDAGRTYALIEAIEEPAQGEEEMFILDGLEIAARSDGDRTRVITSRVSWLVRRALHRRWETKTVRTLSGV